jgi:hypothetical protein
VTFRLDNDYTEDTELSAEYPPQRERGYTEDTGWWIALWIISLWLLALYGLASLVYRIFQWAHP